MNAHNLEAINALFEMPPKPNGINENFYWAVNGNWPAISKILAAHFAADAPEVKPTIEQYKEQVDSARSLILHACDIMETHQVGQWAGVREWLERDTETYVPQPQPRT